MILEGMKNNFTRNRLMLFMLLLGYCHIGCGQEQVLVDTLNVQVYFRQGYSILEFDYRDNAKRLAAFVDSVRTLQGSASCRVKTFRIVGTASPEGVSVLNKRLSENRAKNLVAWIEEYISLEGATLDIQALGIDWERLERQVVASDMPYRDEVLEILRNTPVWVIRDGKVVDSRNRQLGMLRGGRAWRYMEEYFFPELRSAGVRLVCEMECPASASQPEPAPQPEPEPEPGTDPESPEVPEPDPNPGSGGGGGGGSGENPTDPDEDTDPVIIRLNVSGKKLCDVSENPMKIQPLSPKPNYPDLFMIVSGQKI